MTAGRLAGHRQEGRAPDERAVDAGRRAGPARAGRPSTTRPGSRSSPAGCTRPGSRWSPPARRPRGSPRPGVPVTAVEELTGFPECLDGRVKTLHPRVHAGILADRRNADHVRAARRARHRAVRPARRPTSTRSGRPSPPAPRRTSSSSRSTSAGPSMVRAAAKNHPSVAVVVDPRPYGEVLDAVRARRLHPRAAPACWPREAFAHTAAYDVAVASWIGSVLRRPSDGTGVPRVHRRDLGARRRAALRREPAPAGRALPATGGPASRTPSSCTARRCPTTTTSTPTPRWRAAYDHDRARASRSSSTPTPAASRSAPTSPRRTAGRIACDPVSAYGGVIAVNRPVTAAMAEQVAEVFTEVVVAPGLRAGGAGDPAPQEERPAAAAAAAGAPRPVEFRPISGGVLVQAVDRSTPAPGDGGGDDPSRWRLAPATPADEATLADLAFAWRAVRAVKSNAILLAKDGAQRRHRHGPGQPGRLVPARGRARRARSGRRARWPRPTRSSRSPTASRSCSRRASAPWCSRAARCATTRWSRPPCRRGDDVPDRRPALRALICGTRRVGDGVS